MSSVLKPGESLIWYDRPPRLQLVGRWMLLLVFMFAWTVFALAWTQKGWTAHMVFSSLLGAPLIALGVVVTVLLVLKAYFVSDLHYGITDKRVIIINTRVLKRVRSISWDWIEAVDHAGYGDRGTILLTGPEGRFGRERVELFRIHESREVADAICKRL